MFTIQNYHLENWKRKILNLLYLYVIGHIQFSKGAV